jgi:hypothetical protein
MPPKPVDTLEIKDAAVTAPKAPKPPWSYAVIGIIEEKANSLLGTSHIIDRSGRQGEGLPQGQAGFGAAALRVLLAQRRCHRRSSRMPDPAKPGPGDKAPLILVDDIRLLH